MTTGLKSRQEKTRRQEKWMLLLSSSAQWTNFTHEDARENRIIQSIHTVLSSYMTKDGKREKEQITKYQKVLIILVGPF